MNLPTSSLTRRVLCFASAVALTGGLFWSLSSLASGTAHAAVGVQLDERPLAAAVSPDMFASFAPIIKRVAPSVVKVEVTERAKNVPVTNLPEIMNNPLFRQLFGNQLGNLQNGQSTPQVMQPAEAGLGSGVIVSSDGYVLTNHHVVNGADTIKVTLTDGREFTAKLVGTDPSTEIAVIKIDAKNLPAITFADSDKLEVGDRVLAVGNPFGIGQTVTGGMVSALGRATLGLDYEDFIQTDAAINPGNSGGALVDMSGRLIGINTAILSRSGGSQGIGFAIPANLTRNVMEQLVDTGKVVRGFIGVNVQDVTPALADEFKLKDNTGALVADVSADSPAAKAGIKSGDVITTIGGKPILDARHLKLAVGGLAPGAKIAIGLLRDGKTQSMDLKVGNLPGDHALASASKTSPGQTPAAKDEGTLNGVGVADLATQLRREFDVPLTVKGAIVTEVAQNSAAAAAGLTPGDVIEEINHQSVDDAATAVKLTEKPDTRKTLLRIWSQKGTRYVIVDETKVAGNS